MTSTLRGLLARTPPRPVILVLIGLLIFVPLASWVWADLREFAYGGSPAAELVGPYFWGVLLFRLFGAIFLACLLWFVRKPASIWITTTSVWLAGPPLQMLLTGIFILARTGAQRSTIDDPLKAVLVLSIGPAIVTWLLLAFRSSRKAYGLSRED
jgi:hypothetical protein